MDLLSDWFGVGDVAVVPLRLISAWRSPWQFSTIIASCAVDPAAKALADVL